MILNVQFLPVHVKALFSSWNKCLLSPFHTPDTTISPRNAKLRKTSLVRDLMAPQAPVPGWQGVGHGP